MAVLSRNRRGGKMKLALRKMTAQRNFIFFTIFLVSSLVGHADEALPPFPLAGIVDQVSKNLISAKIEPTKIQRDDYLEVISGIVDYFQHFQDGHGCIVDPF